MTTPNTVNLQTILDGPRNAVVKAFLQSAGTQSAVAATATLTFTGAPTAGESFVLNGVTFTARASGATGDEFDIGGNVTTTAANVKAAVNASVTAGVAGVISADNVAGVVTFTAVTAGAAGNSLTLTEGLSNATRTVFAGGADAVGELADQIAVDVSALLGAPSKVHLTRVKSCLRGFDVLLEWEATTDKPILTLTPESGVSELDFRDFGGLPNDAGAGATGDISMTTVGFGATTDAGWVLLEVTKD